MSLFHGIALRAVVPACPVVDQPAQQSQFPTGLQPLDAPAFHFSPLYEKDD